MLKLRKDTLINYIMFLSMLFIGSDIFALSIANFNVRIVQLLLVIAFFLIMLTDGIKMNNVITISLFLISNLLSIFVTYDYLSSIMYFVWTVYNYIFVFIVFSNWTRKVGFVRVYELWRVTFLIQGILLIIQFILVGIGVNILSYQIYLGIPRPALWFYEPSYVATYFCIFFSISIYLFINTKESMYKKDSILALIFLIFITSSTGFIGIGITLFLIVLLSFNKLAHYLKDILKFLLIIILIGSLIYLVYPNIFDTFIGRLFQSGIIESSGARANGWDTAWEVFLNNKIFGVGANAYEAYTGSLYPPTNVSLEVLATLGISGFLTFSLFILTVVTQAFYKSKKYSRDNYLIVRGLLFSFIVFFIVLQANQNYLRLYMWMHLGIIASGVVSKPHKQKF